MNRKVFLFLIGLFFLFPVQPWAKEEDIYFERGVEYINQGEYDKAISEFRKALDLNPNYVNAYCGIAIAHINQKNYKQAIEFLEKGIAIDPGKAIAYYLLGMAYERLGNYDKAVPMWEKYLLLNPKGKYAERVRKHLKRAEEYK